MKNLKPSPDSAVKRSSGRPPNVASGIGETPRQIGSARTILVGTSSPNLAMGAKKIKNKITFKLHINFKKIS